MQSYIFHVIEHNFMAIYCNIYYILRKEGSKFAQQDSVSTFSSSFWELLNLHLIRQTRPNI